MSVKESYTVECAGDAAGELQTLLLEQLLRQIRTEAGSDPANKKKHC